MQVRFQAYTPQFRFPNDETRDDNFIKTAKKLQYGQNETPFCFLSPVSKQWEIGVVSGKEQALLGSFQAQRDMAMDEFYKLARLEPGQNPMFDAQLDTADSYLQSAIGVALSEKSKSLPTEKPQPRLRLVTFA